MSAFAAQDTRVGLERGDWAPGPSTSALLSAQTPEQLLERDARLSFTPRATQLAKAILEREDGLAAENERALALLTLGLARSERERGQLEAGLCDSSLVVRMASTLALGELGHSEALLESLRADPDPALVEVAGLALDLDQQRADRTHMLLTAMQQSASPRSLAARGWLEFRWQAAQRFGLIDGQSYPALFGAELGSREDFLDALVFDCVELSRRPGVRDHLLSALLEQGSTRALRSIAAQMPGELTRLVLSGLWRPSDPAQWQALLEALDQAQVTGQALDLLRVALNEPSVRDLAALQLLGAGIEEAFDVLSPALTRGGPVARAAIARALGQSGTPDWLGELARLRLDTDPAVRSAALVAQVRLGHAPAADELRAILARGEGAEREAAVRALLEIDHDAAIWAWLDEAFSRLSGSLRLECALSLARGGRISARSELRSALETGSCGELLFEVFEVLSQDADARELTLLRRDFPNNQGLELNLLAAKALVRARDPAGTELLRKALWSEPWHRGALAAALMADAGGIRALEDELASPPARVSDRDLRRVGFALGELGGPDAVQRLSLKRRTADPALVGAYLGAMAARTY